MKDVQHYFCNNFYRRSSSSSSSFFIGRPTTSNTPFLRPSSRVSMKLVSKSVTKSTKNVYPSACLSRTSDLTLHKKLDMSRGMHRKSFQTCPPSSSPVWTHGIEYPISPDVWKKWHPSSNPTTVTLWEELVLGHFRNWPDAS